MTFSDIFISKIFIGSTSPMPRNSLPRGAVPPVHSGIKSMTLGKSAALQEFASMDERMTNQLLSVQQQVHTLLPFLYVNCVF